MVKPRSIRLALVLVLGGAAGATSAQGWCDTQLSLMESVANVHAGSPLVYFGSKNLQLIVGQVDETYMFTGRSIASDGAETDVAFQISPGGPSIYRLMGRAPPRTLKVLQPHDYFVGLASEDKLVLFDDGSTSETKRFNVLENECTKGYELSPSPGDIEALKICLMTGRCDS